ncbi:MAG: cytidine deaminase [Bacteroidales bacterium]|nr:cytidine deaminase [Bacteroidales bacterium]
MKPVTITITAQLLDYNELTAQQRQLVDAAKRSSEKAYAPYSRFNVGAAVLLDNGEMVVGNNQENAASPSSLCAERVTMYSANALWPNVAPSAIAIAAFNDAGFLAQPISPCGACRQVLAETEQRYGKPIEVLLYGTEGILVFHCVDDLLPFSFSRLQLDYGK